MPFVNGLLFGLVFIFAIGPSFFLLIQNSIEYGFRKGALIAIGISLSDVVYVSLTLIGFATLISNPEYSKISSIAAASILAAFGIYSMLRKPKIYNDKLLPERGFFRFIGTGFLINIFNPSIAIFWLSLSSTITASYDYTWSEKRSFFIGMLITILTLDLIKAFMANRVRSMITVRAVKILNIIVGTMLFIFAISLIIRLSL